MKPAYVAPGTTVFQVALKHTVLASSPFGGETSGISEDPNAFGE